MRTKQILTQSSHRQMHRRAGRGPFKDTDGMEITKEESNLLSLLETLFALSLVVFKTTPHSKSVAFKAKLPQIYADFSIR